MKILDKVYRIATLQEPTDEIRRLLEGQELERALELLYMLRSWPNVRNPAGFLRRAIQEGWEPSTQPQKVNRRIENIEERFYMNRGLNPEQAHQEVVKGREWKGWNQ